jgi:hypothetical protein
VALCLVSLYDDDDMGLISPIRCHPAYACASRRLWWDLVLRLTTHFMVYVYGRGFVL